MALSTRKIEKDTEEDRMLNELFVSPIRAGFLEVGEDKYVIPIYYEKLREKVDKFEVRDDDVWVTGHPKAGTTWLYHMVNAIVNNLDKEASKLDFSFRSYLLDYSIVFDVDKINADLGLNLHPIEELNQRKSPRCIKSHLHWSLLPEQLKNGTKTPKIIYILRNPKDTCVSYFYHSQWLNGFKGNFEQFSRLFLAGRLNHGPFFATMLSFWHEKSRPNILFVHYKDLKKDLAGSIRTISEFLGKSFTDDQIQSLVEQLTFSSMQKEGKKKQDPAIQKFFEFYNLSMEENKFFRVGKEGGYRAEMSPDLIQKFDAWTKRSLAGTGLTLE